MDCWRSSEQFFKIHLMKKIEQFIRLESKSVECCEKALSVFHEMMEGEGEVNIDVEDVMAAFKPGREVRGFEFSIPADANNRVASLSDMAKAELGACCKIESMVFKLLCPAEREVTMDEMGLLTTALNSVVGDIPVVWGFAFTENSSELRMLMLCQ